MDLRVTGLSLDSSGADTDQFANAVISYYYNVLEIYRVAEQLLVYQERFGLHAPGHI